jgi:hypothetical protein
MSHLFTPFSAIQAEGIGRAQKLATLLTPDRTEQFRLLAKTPLKDPVGSVVSEGGPCCELPVGVVVLDEVNAPMMRKHAEGLVEEVAATLASVPSLIAAVQVHIRFQDRFPDTRDTRERSSGIKVSCLRLI